MVCCRQYTSVTSCAFSGGQTIILYIYSKDELRNQILHKINCPQKLLQVFTELTHVLYYDARLDMKTHSISAPAEFCLLNAIFSTLYLLLTYFDTEHLLRVAYSAGHVRESH